MIETTTTSTESTSPTTAKGTGAVKARGTKTEAGAKTSKRSRTSPITPDDRRRMISELAYLRAEQRGFQGGDAVEDWLAAEAEVDRMLSKRKRTSPR